MSQAIEIHSVIEGTIIRIMPFGALVRIGAGSQGLVHISHVSNQYVQDINEFLAVGDTVWVKVLSIDQESGRIALSIKDAKLPEQNSREMDKPPGSTLESFEDKLKKWTKVSNERHMEINRRSKRR